MFTTRKIEQYLDGTLNEREKIFFEMLAHLNEKLAELIILHKEVNESIMDNKLYFLRKQLKQVSESYFIARSFESNAENEPTFKHKYLCHRYNFAIFRSVISYQPEDRNQNTYLFR
jgi:hypothetical protein